MSGTRKSGRVKWFNNAKGYGFVTEEGKDDELFTHYSQLRMDGYKTLKKGQRVTSEILQAPKGPHAINIQPVEVSVEVSPDEDGAAGDRRRARGA
ncbi:cold shock domain-containing protein [Streptomyces sp. NPDC048558]|uniref:cold shock domain-containing protein n=1 Tax=Streptomyces sp. NPDC048558 TaxID=3155759 RepID=UPI0034491B49